MKSEGRSRTTKWWRFSAQMKSHCCVVPRTHTHLKSVSVHPWLTNLAWGLGRTVYFISKSEDQLHFATVPCNLQVLGRWFSRTGAVLPGLATWLHSWLPQKLQFLPTVVLLLQDALTSSLDANLLPSFDCAVSLFPSHPYCHLSSPLMTQTMDGCYLEAPLTLNMSWIAWDMWDNSEWLCANETKQVSEKAHKTSAVNKADFYMQSTHFWLG